MGAAQDILAEVESLISTLKPARSPDSEAAPTVSEVTLESGEPSAAFLDERGLRMRQYCERAVELLNKSIETQTELRDVFIALHDLWVDDEQRPGEGEPDEDPDDENEEEEEEEEEGEDDEDGPAATTEAAPEAVASAEEEIPVHLEEPSADAESLVPPSVPQPTALSPRRQRFLAEMRAAAGNANVSQK